jgi:hypothetical protein
MMVKGSIYPSLVFIHMVVVKIGTEAACLPSTIAGGAAGEISPQTDPVYTIVLREVASFARNLPQ